MLSKQVKDRRFMNKLKRTITGHRAVKVLGISPEVLADQERVSRAMPVPRRAFTGDPSRVPVLTDVVADPRIKTYVDPGDPNSKLSQMRRGPQELRLLEPNIRYAPLAELTPEQLRAHITDTSSLKAMYPAGHMDWKIGGPELSPQK